MNGWMGGWVGGWVGGWLDGWMGGWMDGWMVGWVFTVCATCNVISHGIHNYIPKTNHVTTVYTVLQLFCIYSLRYM